MNAAAYNIQQGYVFPLCGGWMLKKKKKEKSIEMHLLKTLILVRALHKMYIKRYFCPTI